MDWNDAAWIGRLKYFVGAIGALLGFAAIWLDRYQMEIVYRKQQPRTITPQQQTAFMKTLEGTPRGPLKMQYLSASTETYAFAQQVYALLRMAKYDLPPEPEGLSGAISFGPPPVGIQIESKDPDKPPPLVEPLRMAFRANRFRCPAAASARGER